MYTLPEIVDPDNDKILMKVTVNSNETIPNFISYNTKSMIFYPLSSSEVGTYDIQILLSDVNVISLTKIYQFQLLVKENIVLPAKN